MPWRSRWSSTEIDQDADRRIERGRKIDLIGRTFDHMDADRRCGGASDRIAVPILPPSCASMPADAARWAISAVVVDLPLVPVMATNGASGRVAPPLAAEQLDVADHLDAGLVRERRPSQCGAGWVSGTPGASTSAAILRPVDGVQIGGRECRPPFAFATLCRVVVEGDDVGAAGQAARSRSPAPSRPGRTRRPFCRQRS